jgi:hypothetical protein
MKETIEKAKEELKRADHLYYVSLKYTKTVDVIKSIIERLINAFDFAIDALFLYLQKKKKVKEIPTSPLTKCVEIKKLFPDDQQFLDDIDFYVLLRRIIKADYTSAREFRKNVTMSVNLEDNILDINLEILLGYFRRTKNFVDKAYNLIYGIKDE